MHMITCMPLGVVLSFPLVFFNCMGLTVCCIIQLYLDLHSTFWLCPLLHHELYVHLLWLYIQNPIFPYSIKCYPSTGIPVIRSLVCVINCKPL